MSFSTEKEKRTSNRFMLVRIEPGFYANDDLSLVSGDYKMAFTEIVSRVERNGVELTRDTAVPTVDDHYFFDEENGQFYVQLASAPDVDDNVIIVFFYQFFTGEKNRRIPETPTDSSTTLRPWEPRLEVYPQTANTISNILNGTLSIGSLTLNLINNDFFFEQYLGTNYSYFRKDVNIWFCINNEENIFKGYRGKISDVSTDLSNFNIVLYDQLNKLNQKATFGPPELSYWSRNVIGNTLDPAKDGQPIPIMFGPYTPHQTLTRNFDRLSSNTRVGHQVNPVTMFEAVNLDQEQADIGILSNRSWGFCRYFGALPPTAGTSDYTLGTPTSLFFDNDIVNITTSGHNVRSGQTILFDDGGSNQDYLRVIGSTSTIIYCATDDTIGYVSYTTGHLSLLPFMTVVIEHNDPATNTAYYVYPKYGRDYTFTYHYHGMPTTETPVVRILFVSDFMAANLGAPGFMYTANRVFYVMYGWNNNADHENVLEEFLSHTGIDYDSTSITQAGTDLDAEACFSVPYRTESDFGDYLSYVQKLLASVFGFIGINDSFQVTYELFTTTSASTAITSDLILLSSLRASVNYQDIFNEIISITDHQAIDPVSDGPDFKSYTHRHNKSKYLHNIIRVLKFDNMIIDTTRITLYAQLIRNRKIQYTFKTSTEHFDSLLGEDVTLEHAIIAGTSGTDNLKIVSLKKDTNDVEIEANDLGDF